MKYNAKEKMFNINFLCSKILSNVYRRDLEIVWYYSVKVREIWSPCKRFGDFHLNMAGKYFYGLLCG